MPGKREIAYRYGMRLPCEDWTRGYRNRPPSAASRIISRFFGSSMNLGSARISCVTIVPSAPLFRSCRPPPAGSSPRISSPYLVRLVGLAASLAAVVVPSPSTSNA